MSLGFFFCFLLLLRFCTPDSPFLSICPSLPSVLQPLRCFCFLPSPPAKPNSDIAGTKFVLVLPNTGRNNSISQKHLFLMRFFFNIKIEMQYQSFRIFSQLFAFGSHPVPKPFLPISSRVFGWPLWGEGKKKRRKRNPLPSTETERGERGERGEGRERTNHASSSLSVVTPFPCPKNQEPRKKRRRFEYCATSRKFSPFSRFLFLPSAKPRVRSSPFEFFRLACKKRGRHFRNPESGRRNRKDAKRRKVPPGIPST